MKQAIVTGAAGFTGVHLVERLLEDRIEVFAVVRPNSPHNARLSTYVLNCHLVECYAEEYDALAEKVRQTGWLDHEPSVCFHLLNAGDGTVREQMKNIPYAIEALEAAHSLNCYRFVATGSQAEYGVVPPNTLTEENLPLQPITAYGISKAVSCELSRLRAKELGVEWIWGRIFSLIGRYELSGRMLPDLYHGLERGEELQLTSCSQNWDYLDVRDAAGALEALAKKGQDGEIYNIASNSYRVLREYTEMLRKTFLKTVPFIMEKIPNRISHCSHPLIKS